jgi:hypothetical protein
MKHGNWVVQSGLYRAGNAAIAQLGQEGWIEQWVSSGSTRQFRITPAGSTALPARIR